MKRIKCNNFEEEYSVYIPQGFKLVDGYWEIEDES